jgi:hypothetical protein
LNGIDELIELLIAVGQTSRDNIESMQYPWESRSDSERRWDDFPDFEDDHLKPPALHISECVQLLKQYKRLKFLGSYFENELMLNTPPEAFMANPGIEALYSIRGIRRDEIWNLGDEPLEQCYLAKRLRETIEDRAEEEEPKKERTRLEYRLPGYGVGDRVSLGGITSVCREIAPS